MNTEPSPRTEAYLSPEESEECYRSVVTAMADGVVFQDSAGRVVFCNPSAERILGFQAGKALGITFEDHCWRAIREDGSLFPVSEHPAMITLQTGEPCDGVLMGLQGDRQTVTWISVSTKLFNRKGEAASRAVISTFADVTARRHTEMALKAREKLYQTLVENQNEGIGIVDLEERFIFTNRAGEEIFGVTAGGLAGRSLNDFLEPESVPFVLDQTKARREGQRNQYELEIIRQSDKSKRTILVSAAPQVDDSGAVSGTFGIFSDITERKSAEAERERLQAQFLQAQKMESVGRLAGGVAHDFNNLLTVINGYSAMVLNRMRPDDPLRPMITGIHKACESAVTLIRQLLAFSRKQVLRQELVDLNHMVRDMGKMLRRLVGEDIEIIANLSPALDAVIADRHQLELAIMNLTINARDAMPRGGTLIIETGHALWDDKCPHCLSVVRPGPYVRMSVSDTGTGIDEETRQHLFEPFFTTKKVGHGTGLGLATVHGIVLQSGGHIDVESQPGVGTSFHIYLPAEPAVEEAKAGAAPSTAAGGTETILLVEDRDEVRMFTNSVLQEYGYRVIPVSSGDEALDKCAAQQIDLLLTDVVMPKMRGCDLAGRVRSLQPRVKVLFMSGYSDEVVAGRAGALAGSAFIQKPFAPDALAEKVREVLTLTTRTCAASE